MSSWPESYATLTPPKEQGTKSRPSPYRATVVLPLIAASPLALSVFFCFHNSPTQHQAGEARTTVSLNAERRQAVGSIAAAAAAFLPVAAANAAAGESPRFSVFGLIGDGSSYSEGAAYGSDQSTATYSPYSVYDKEGANAVYAATKGGAAEVEKKKGVLAESRKRLGNLPAYVNKKQWFNVRDELTRYMYETRGATRYLAKTNKQKEKADDFFKAIEEVFLQAGLKNQDKCAAAVAKSVVTLDAFTASL